VSGTIAYTRSTAGEVMSITNQTYQNLPQNPPNLVSNVVNGPDGPVSYTLGNGLNVYQGYDTLGRLTGRWVCSGPATMYCSGGTQVYGTGGPWRGTRMLSQSDTVLNQQVTFGYDEFNRLNARTVTQGTLQNYTYSYDRYGNRLTQTPLQGGYTFNPTINPVNNQITTSPYTYDPAGNMLHDLNNAYTYDAEGNLVEVVGPSGTSQYVYDVFNRRIQVQTASATTEYIYDYAGRRVSSWASPNTGNEGRIYWDGQLIAHRSLEALTYFDHEDTLGTQRIRTNYAGYVASTYLSLPWGDGYSATVNNFGGDQDNLHFAGLEHDAESDTEHAQFRNYASAQGRWLGPDSYLGSYDLTNPQSMNRYAYALNNPTSFTDHKGLFLDGDPGDTVDAYTGGNDTGGGSQPDCNSNDTVCVTGTPPTVPDPCDAVSCFPGGSNPGPGGTQRTPGNPPAPKNGRNCTAGPASAGQYLAATAQVEAMTEEFLVGLGPGNLTYGPDSATSQVMAQSAGVQEVLGAYYMTGQTSGLYSFGASGAYVAGGNPVAQFVGSFRWSISGGVLSLTNTTSIRSLTYDHGPQYQRGSLATPGGNTHQTYQIGVTCH